MPDPGIWRDWLGVFTGALGAAGIIIPVIRRYLVNPIVAAMQLHAEQHERMDHELKVNGFEDLLAPKDRGLPLRALVIHNAVALELLTQDVAAHRVVQEPSE